MPPCRGRRAPSRLGNGSPDGPLTYRVFEGEERAIGVAVNEIGQPYTPGALTKMRYRPAPSGRAAGGNREVARACRRLDHGEDLCALSGRRAAGCRPQFGRSCDIVVTLR